MGYQLYRLTGGDEGRGKWHVLLELLITHHVYVIKILRMTICYIHDFKNGRVITIFYSFFHLHGALRFFYVKH